MPTITKNNLLLELLDSATTPDELQAVEQLLAEQERRRQSRWTVATLGEVAAFFGLAVQTVKQWRIETPPCPGREGAWSLPEIVRWRIDKASATDVSVAKKQQDLELGSILLEQKRLDLSREKGELLERDAVELWAAQAMVECREMMMQLPEMISSAAAPEIREFTREETDRHVRAILSNLRRRLESAAIEGDEVPGAAPEGDVG